MKVSPLGPRKRVYLGLAALLVAAAGPAQWLVERARTEAFGPPRDTLQIVELWPVLLGGFRGPMVAGLAHFAQQKEIEADVYTTLSSVKALIRLQPEFDHLWIFYSWVIAYNLTAVISPPEEKYPLLTDGVRFLEGGLGQITELYEGRRPFVNERCPITNVPVVPGEVPDHRIRAVEGQKVAFGDDAAGGEWERLPETERLVRLERVRGGTFEYRRKRATLLYMIGWTYYQKLASGAEPKAYYRRWFIRDTGKDPFQLAYQYLARASAVDVPPYQVSYQVIKTSPVHCRQDWARALAEDEKVPTHLVAEAFDLAWQEWQVVLPTLDEKHRVRHSVREMELVSQAVRMLALAEDKASVGNIPESRAAMDQAVRLLDRLEAEQPGGAFQHIYRARLKIAADRVTRELTGGGT